MQEEIEHKTVNLAISTTKLSARTLLRGMQFLLHSKCTVRTLGSNVTIQMVGSVFVLYCEIPTRQ